MDPRTATEQQISHYRRMTGEERLAIALELHELACEVARAGIRAQFPGADAVEIERRLQERIALSHRLTALLGGGPAGV